MIEDTHTIRSNGLKAESAELSPLKNLGVEFIWQAGPPWPHHAPLLFPVGGRLNNDELLHRGRTYRMTQHGFARDGRFVWFERSAIQCALSEDAGTRVI